MLFKVGPWSYITLVAVTVIHLVSISGGEASRFPTYDTSVSSTLKEAASAVANVQKGQAKITDPMMLRYCTDVTPDDCADFMSGNGHCVNLVDTLPSGSFLVLYPSKMCYLYRKMDCKGLGNYEFEGRWSLASETSAVSSYRCFK